MQKNIIQSETWVGGFQLSAELYDRFIYVKNIAVTLWICFKIVVTIVIVIKCAINLQCDRCIYLRIIFWSLPKSIPLGIYMFKVNNRNARTRCEICSKLTIRTLEQHHWRRFGVFIVNFEHISYLVLVYLLLTLRR